MNRLPFELTVPRDVYEAIGHMLCQWAHFEQSVNESLFELSGAVTDYARFRIGQQQFKTRLGTWQELVAPHIKQRLTRGYLTKFYIKGAKLKDDRDAIAHFHLGVDDEGQLIRIRYKHAQFKELRDIDARSVQRIACRISIINYRLRFLQQLTSSNRHKHDVDT
jgi:hypothetical protein